MRLDSGQGPDPPRLTRSGSALLYEPSLRVQQTSTACTLITASNLAEKSLPQRLCWAQMPISKRVAVTGGDAMLRLALYYLHILWSIRKENDAISLRKETGHWMAVLVGEISISCYNKQSQTSVA